MADVNIVVPTYNHYDLLNALLLRLYKFERDTITSVLVMDDCSPNEEVQPGLAWWKSTGLLPLEVIHNEENLGFLLNSNTGLKKFETGITILLSTDVIIYGKFFQQIIDIIEQEPKSLVGGVLYSHDTGWNKFDRIYPYIEGWLLATTSEGWKELDYLDPLYAPCDFEDVDLSTKAITKGYQLVPLNNPSIHHMGGQSIKYGPEREAQTLKNQEKFKAKWVK